MACLLCVVLLVSMAAAAVAPPSRAVDLLSVSKRRVPKGPDPVHNREFREVPQGRIAPSGGGGLLCFAIEPTFMKLADGTKLSPLAIEKEEALAVASARLLPSAPG
ncbi:hypothetical protein HPP92_015915 [Vanilla planifolia]|uniref:Uncharacterized protein n=1 Tax=Vanilla planifolia TaxID=51239 RepID=A0A835QM33_VANPL|nr:hypothetical protein HPP92_015915 [Vanilla planifolia]